MKRKKKCRFINLAEQLTIQNDIVSSTMDSLLKFVSEDKEVESRPDVSELQKTADMICEMNPAVDSESAEPSKTNKRLPRPKMSLRRNATKDKIEG